MKNMVPNLGPKVIPYKEQNDKDDVIADVIPIAMGNPHDPEADLWW